MTKVLLTGAGGFGGAHAFEHILAKTDWELTAIDSFRHKGRCDRLSRILFESPDLGGWRQRTRVITHDLCAPFSDMETEKIGQTDLLIAMASESHVERSIKDPVPFFRNNTELMLNTLELARELQPKMVVIVSTDEVYGPVAPGYAHPEWAPMLPSNPYAASKVAQEAAAIAYWRTYGVPVVILNCMNLIGEMQDPEKYAPMVMRRVLSGETVHIHGTPGNVGSRFYIHARNLADAIVYLYRNTEPVNYPYGTGPDRYNIAGPAAVDNLAFATFIAETIGKPLRYELVDFHSARPGHDPHYGLDGSKIAEIGWRPPVEFWESMERCVRWTVKRPEWVGL